MPAEPPTTPRVLTVYLLVVAAGGLLIVATICGLTTVDAYGDIGCVPGTESCWPTDWREVAFDCFLTALAFVGGVTCAAQAMRFADGH